METVKDSGNTTNIVISQDSDPGSTVKQDEDERIKKWMKVALDFAKEALVRGEVPVGCLFLLEDVILANGSNTVNQTKNATRHAEMNCIDDVLRWCKENNKEHSEVFKDIDVVVTVEPCIMCAAALHQLGIKQICYGCANTRFGGCASVLDTAIVYKGSSCKIKGGVFADEAIYLLKEFYKGTNPNAPKSKVKVKKKIEVSI